MLILPCCSDTPMQTGLWPTEHTRRAPRLAGVKCSRLFEDSGKQLNMSVKVDYQDNTYIPFMERGAFKHDRECQDLPCIMKISLLEAGTRLKEIAKKIQY